MNELRLRAPTADDDAVDRQAHEAMLPDAFPFAFGYEPEMDFPDYASAILDGGELKRRYWIRRADPLRRRDRSTALLRGGRECAILCGHTAEKDMR